MGGWPRRVAVGLAGLQLVDVIGNELLPPGRLAAHLDHLGVPNRLRPALPVIKVAGSAGLVLGLRLPLLGAVTSGCLVGYYAAAAMFHLHAGDHPVVCLPAMAFGGAAAASLVKHYLPAIAGAK